MATSHTRRSFLAKSLAGGSILALSAESYARIIGANDRISIGLIGCGDRIHREQIPNIAKHAKAQNVEIIMACDPWRVARERAAAAIQDAFGVKPQLFETHGDLLESDDVDAVMISSCDHQHARQLVASVREGKDAYCEKPIAKTLTELNGLYDAVKESGNVVQVGTQLRSLPTTAGCRAVYKTGVLGTVARIEQRRNGSQPYWYSYIKDVKREDVNWDEFIMGGSRRPFDPVAYSAWMGYRDFSDGPIVQLAVHFLDSVHFITGAELPESCVSLGGIYTWKDDHRFEVPDHVQALWTYPDGFMVSYSSNFGNPNDSVTKMIGDKGVLDLSNLDAPLLQLEGKNQQSVEPIPCPDHWLDWLQCLRTRKSPNAPIEAGYSQTVACLMAIQAYDTGRRVVFDKWQRTIQDG